MRHIAAYLLLQIGGNENPTFADVERVLAAVGIEADKERLSRLLQELEGKDIKEVIASGSKELAFGSVPSGAKPSGTEAGRDPEGKAKDIAELDGETQGDDDDDEGDIGIDLGGLWD